MIVKAACPHDCPDTCAMLVRVDGAGRAIEVSGNPDQPVTAGFLCGKVSNYLDRVYAPDRLLKPLIRTGPKGAGEFREATWDEALDAVATGLRSAIEEHGGESILPYSYAGTQGLLQGDTMSARVMHALGASKLERTICATAGITGAGATQGISPEVDPELWPRSRYVIAWGWNPMSTAPHLWRLLLEARRNGAKLVVIDPYRSRTARVADEHLQPLPGTDGALALAMMRAISDAGLVAEEWCREHTTGFDDLLARVAERSVAEWAEPTGIDGHVVARIATEFAEAGSGLLRAGVGAQRHAGATIAYRTLACLPALAGSWREPGGGFSYIPTATAAALSSAPLRGGELTADSERTVNMSQVGDALTALDDPPVAALVCWNSNPAQVAPDQDKVLAGLRREDLFTVVLEQFMTDTAAHADVVLPATTQLEHTDVVWSWGHHYLTWNEAAIEPQGEARSNTDAFRLIAERMGLEGDAFTETDDQMLERAFEHRPGGIGLEDLRARGFAKIDLGQGETPHRDGAFVTPSGKLQLRTDWLEQAGVDPVPFYDPPAEIADEVLAERFPLALLTPKTHLFLNSTFANGERQHAAQPAPFVVLHPDDAAARGVEDGARVRVFNDRGYFEVEARVGDDTRAGVAVAPMGWWNRDYAGGASSQATTPQLLTTLGNAPTFNDNRVEVERA